MAIYFSASDEIRTLKYLGYTPNEVVVLRVRQRIAYDKFGDDIVTEVRSLLDKLDALDTLEATYASDASSSLVRADVLEWNPAGRQANLDKRRATLLQQLSTIFDLQIQRKGYSGTRVYRS